MRIRYFDYYFSLLHLLNIYLFLHTWHQFLWYYQVMKIPCGGWRRPHSYFLGDVPELKNCFAFVKGLFLLWTLTIEKIKWAIYVPLRFIFPKLHGICSLVVAAHNKKMLHSLKKIHSDYNSLYLRSFYVFGLNKNSVKFHGLYNAPLFYWLNLTRCTG
jgi:hypothetical protein